MDEPEARRNGFEPVIVGFFCNWCSYAGADIAGTARMHYPSNLRIVRVMVGVGSDRLRLEWISASEGPKVAATVADFVETLKQLGPSPFRRSRS
jgi:coenzyme F420-reducing hydrogenase delta subunit